MLDLGLGCIVFFLRRFPLLSVLSSEMTLHVLSAGVYLLGRPASGIVVEGTQSALPDVTNRLEESPRSRRLVWVVIYLRQLSV